MAVTSTGSDPPWAHLYHHSTLPTHDPSSFHILGGRGTTTVDSVVVTTTATYTPTAGNYTGTSDPSSSSSHRPGAIDGRVSKPAKKRSRASRRAPTTLLNTDTTNFRAMVQQFTGIPSSTNYPQTTFTAGAISGQSDGGGIGLPVRQGGQHINPSDHFYHQLQQQHQLQRGAIAADEMGSVYPIIGNTNHPPLFHLLSNQQQRINSLAAAPRDQFPDRTFSNLDQNAPMAAQEVQSSRNMVNYSSNRSYVYDQEHDDRERKYFG